MVAAHKKCPEAEIIGYDISHSRVDAARIRAKVAGERLSVVYGNVFALNPDDGKYFDKVFCHVPLGIRDNMGKHHFPSGPEFENVIAAEFPRFSGLPRAEGRCRSLGREVHHEPGDRLFRDPAELGFHDGRHHEVARHH